MIQQPVILQSSHRQLLLRRLTLLTFDGLLIVVAFLGAFALRLQDRQSLSDVLASQIRLLPVAVKLAIYGHHFRCCANALAQ